MPGGLLNSKIHWDIQ